MKKVKQIIKSKPQKQCFLCIHDIHKKLISLNNIGCNTSVYVNMGAAEGVPVVVRGVVDKILLYETFHLILILPGRVKILLGQFRGGVRLRLR